MSIECVQNDAITIGMVRGGKCLAISEYDIVPYCELVAGICELAVGSKILIPLYWLVPVRALFQTTSPSITE